MAEAEIVDQPPPIATSRTPTWELVIADAIVLGMSDGVIADMRHRDRVGRERYGTPLTTGNGRDHLIDAYQEALDLTVYLRNEIEEHPDHATFVAVAAIYERSLQTAEDLREVIDARINHLEPSRG